MTERICFVRWPSRKQSVRPRAWRVHTVSLNESSGDMTVTKPRVQLLQFLRNANTIEMCAVANAMKMHARRKSIGRLFARSVGPGRVSALRRSRGSKMNDAGWSGFGL